MSMTLAICESEHGPEVRRIAAIYPDEARFTPAKDRERHFSPMQLLAWELRFGDASNANFHRAKPSGEQTQSKGD